MERTTQTDADLAARDLEATDDETLDDLEESFGDSDLPEDEDDDFPSPDGSFEADEDDPI